MNGQCQVPGSMDGGRGCCSSIDFPVLARDDPTRDEVETARPPAGSEVRHVGRPFHLKHPCLPPETLADSAGEGAMQLICRRDGMCAPVAEFPHCTPLQSKQTSHKLATHDGSFTRSRGAKKERGSGNACNVPALLTGFRRRYLAWYLHRHRLSPNLATTGPHGVASLAPPLA